MYVHIVFRCRLNYGNEKQSMLIIDDDDDQIKIMGMETLFGEKKGFEKNLQMKKE